MITHPNSTAVVTPDAHQRNTRCAGLGFKSLVRSATTASLGMANERMPGQKAAMVYLITFCCCSTLRVLKCWPLPDSAAALEMPRFTMPQIWILVSKWSIQRGKTVV
jgi:hypothetical protein